MKLKHYTLHGVILASISSEVLFGAILRLETLELGFRNITEDQVSGILTMMKDKKQGRLVKIKMAHRSGYLATELLPLSMTQELKMNRILVWI